MADFNSSLPIRTESAGDAIVKVADSAVPSQQLAVNADGSVNITDNSGSITVDAADLDIRDLSASQDNVAISDGTDSLEINADGSLNITDNGGSLTVDATDLDIRDLSAAQDNVAISDGTDSLEINADGSLNITDNGGSLTVDATDLDIRDLSASQDNVAISDGTDTLAINSDGSINVVVNADVQGTEVVDYNTTSSLAGTTSVNHDYTVTASTLFIGEELWVSGSDRIKVEVLVNAVPVFTAFNSEANLNIRIPLDRMVKATAGQVIRITITNRANQARDVYSTLTGVEVPV